MSGYLYHLAYDFRTGVRDKTLMFMNYIFPIGFFLLVGLFMTRINPAFVDIMIPGMILFAIMSATLLSLPSTLIAQREAGILRSFRVNGVPAGALITIPVLGCVFHTALASILVTAGGALLYGGRAPVAWGWFVFVFFLATLTHATLGILIGIVAGSSRAGTLLAQAVYLPSVLLGGLMVPEELIPESLRLVASFLPAAQAIRGFDAFAMGGAAAGRLPGLPLVVLTASIVVNLCLCFYLFRWDSRSDRRRPVLLALLALLPFAASVLV